MKTSKTGDIHFSAIENDNLLRRLFFPPRRLVRPHVKEKDTVADLGCGPGFFTIALAGLVGPAGKVYAVDSDDKVVRIVLEKAAARGLGNIDARTASAADIGFIGDAAVDFVFAHGLLCAMAREGHAAAVSEIARILKPDGRAYLSAAKSSIGHVDREEWEGILSRFEVLRRGEGFPVLANRWALVRRKP